MKIVGRAAEKRILQSCLDSRKPEFVAVYGRRRVGKTFLVREFFHDNFVFRMTGEFGGDMTAELTHFNNAMRHCGKSLEPDGKQARNWREAFESLRELAEHTQTREQGKRVIFFDELAWIDSPRSGFLSALEHFWNDWGSAQEDVILVICGSVSSWIIRKLFKNRGGLHNRVTRRLRLMPFSLSECEELLEEMNISYAREDVADCYLVFGGIPYYLSMFQQSLSVPQNVDFLCFAADAPLKDEFAELFASLFGSSEKYISVIKALAQKRKGLTRAEVIAEAGLRSGGALTKILDDLEQSGFIYRYHDYSGTRDLYLYQLVDFFSLFSLNFMGGSRRKDIHFWANRQGSGAHSAWKGYSFELLCLTHVDQIRDSLSIGGVSTAISSWRDPDPDSNLQIDLVLDRNDGIIDLFEMKYYKSEFVIDKEYANKLAEKKRAFVRHTRTKKTVHIIMVAKEGLKTNSYSHNVQAALDLEDLWDRRRRH